MTADERAALVAALRDPVAESLADLYACSRVWEAWQYGTMTVEDFAPAAEDEDVIENVIAAVLPAFLAKIEADGKRLAIADAAPHTQFCETRHGHDAVYVDGRIDYYTPSRDCTCWKADYDAAKEAAGG